jgi:hypothetical protein
MGVEAVLALMRATPDSEALVTKLQKLFFSSSLMMQKIPWKVILEPMLQNFLCF